MHAFLWLLFGINLRVKCCSISNSTYSSRGPNLCRHLCRRERWTDCNLILSRYIALHQSTPFITLLLSISITSFICPVFSSSNFIDSIANTYITSVDFASYGTPSGTCLGSFTKSGCDAINSTLFVENYCLGLSTCSFTYAFGLLLCFIIYFLCILFKF